ncbi:MAG: ABC transporter permease subunit [Deltaproteobacteria bacterium]|nr:ABC transporter permease subunit [Deltaproteobacteria bacterium]
MFSISLLEVIIAIVMGVILIYKEVDRKTFYLVLPKPVRRSEVVAGKFTGLLAVLAVAIVVMGLAWVLTLTARGVVLRPDMFKAMILVWMEASLLTSVALFFGSFATPVMSGVFTFGVFLVGRSLVVLDNLLTAKKGLIVTNPEIKFIADTVVNIFPDLSVFNIGKEIILGVPVGWDYVGGAGLYCLGYCICFLALAMLIFSRRDFV